MRRLFVLVAVIVLVDTMFYAATAPLLPYYTQHYHLAKSAAGMLAGTYAAGTLIASLPAGWLAARFGPRTTVLCGLGLMVVTSVGFGLAHVVWLLDTARFVQGIAGAASWAGGLAWLIGRADPERRGELIGTTLSAAIGGALLGPVLGTLAAQTSPAIVFSGVGGLGIGLLLATLSEPAGPENHKPVAGGSARAALRDRRVLLGGSLTMLSAVMYATMSVLAPLRLTHLGASETVVGLAFLLGAGAASLTSPLAGRMNDRRGWAVPVRAGAAVSALWLVLLPLAPAAGWLVALIVLGDATFTIAYPAAGSLLSRGAAGRGVGQAYAFGLFNLTWAIGQVLGTAGSARLAQASSDRVPYWLLAGVCLLLVRPVRRGSAGRLARPDRAPRHRPR